MMDDDELTKELTLIKLMTIIRVGIHFIVFSYVEFVTFVNQNIMKNHLEIY